MFYYNDNNYNDIYDLLLYFSLYWVILTFRIHADHVCANMAV